jgi:hypothetical protein
MIASATESPRFDGQATVADLWASLPGFAAPRDIFGDRPGIVTLEGVQVQDDDRPAFARIAAPRHAVVRFGAPDDVAGLPDTHPSMRGMQQSGTRRNPLGGEEPVYRFPREDGTLRTLYDVGSTPYYLEHDFKTYVVRPKVGTGTSEPPSEFLTLWALLFCLSELARYYPDTWVLALDPDNSSVAVTLEQGLDLMLERAPTLISGALSGPTSTLLRRELREREREAAAATGDENAVEGDHDDGDGAADEEPQANAAGEP